ncbi:hypothetical protein B566_EDAN007422 [Ephemera danica]|nr:hypothetical protein B566_EDAN007422 [Ephemera danica]
MPMTLYCLDASPPVRSVYLCLEALELEAERKVINPQHSVPTFIDDDGFVIWDSHAICSYLVSKYGKDDSLYPKDVKKRAIVDQRLHFDSGILYPRTRDISFSLLFLKCKEIPEEKRKKILDAYELLEKFLEGHDWLAGDSYTIADLFCVASVTSLVLNPQHTIPMINDDGTLIWDSHAICAYLVTVYGKDDSLYPKDPRKRSLVDQRLHFDTGMIFPRILDIIVPLIWRKVTNEIPESEQKRVLKVFDTLEKFLEIGDYVAGNTLEDNCMVTNSFRTACDEITEQYKCWTRPFTLQTQNNLSNMKRTLLLLALFASVIADSSEETASSPPKDPEDTEGKHFYPGYPGGGYPGGGYPGGGYPGGGYPGGGYPGGGYPGGGYPGGGYPGGGYPGGGYPYPGGHYPGGGYPGGYPGYPRPPYGGGGYYPGYPRYNYPYGPGGYYYDRKNVGQQPQNAQPPVEPAEPARRLL